METLPTDDAGPDANLPLGAVRLPDGRTQFVVWAPHATNVKVHLLTPVDRLARTERLAGHYFRAIENGLPAGARYRYRLYGPKRAGGEFPDPASRSQPDGVHGPSAVIDGGFPWSDQGWRGLALADYVTYELHVGAFTAEGTFDTAIGQLDALVDLGVTAIELMPVAQCPGERNWGYDGVYPFAVQHSYGGAAGLKRLVDACHRRGLAVVLDVVYNHLGPEGNYLSQFGPYFTDRYRTPWGEAINFDGRRSDDVRRYFTANALQWIDDFHIDALRLDAVHAIVDNTARPFLMELGEAVHARARELGRQAFLIAETNRNNPAVVRPIEAGGLGLDAQWIDDFGRATHALLTGERHGYYSDFGSVDDVAKALREGYIITGQYSRYRGRRHGTSAGPAPADRFLAFIQNHDEVGNRPGGERLGRLCDFEQLKLAAGLVLLSPYVPMLFMGEEYDEPAPFHYFVDHGDPALVAAVRAGRQREIPAGRSAVLADPAAIETFLDSRLHFELRLVGHHAVLWRYYRRLLALRREQAAVRQTDRAAATVESAPDRPLVAMRRTAPGSEICAVLNLGSDPAPAPAGLIPHGAWRKAIDSAAHEWQGPGETAPAMLTVGLGKRLSSVRLAGWSCVLYVRET